MKKKANINLLLANPNDETTNGIFLKNRNWYHLYITTDEEIKENDYIYNYEREPSIIKCYDKDSLRGWKKIIATTDKSLKIIIPRHNDFDSEWNLPQIPQSFIEHFVSEYNKGNIITKVMVEYEEHINDAFNYSGKDDGVYLKINSNNTINIKPVKDSWSREEVVQLFEKYLQYLTNKNSDFNITGKEWLKQNL